MSKFIFPSSIYFFTTCCLARKCPLRPFVFKQAPIRIESIGVKDLHRTWIWSRSCLSPMEICIQQWNWICGLLFQEFGTCYLLVLWTSRSKKTSKNYSQGQDTSRSHPCDICEVTIFQRSFKKHKETYRLAELSSTRTSWLYRYMRVLMIKKACSWTVVSCVDQILPKKKRTWFFFKRWWHIWRNQKSTNTSRISRWINGCHFQNAGISNPQQNPRKTKQLITIVHSFKPTRSPSDSKWWKGELLYRSYV